MRIATTATVTQTVNRPIFVMDSDPGGIVTLKPLTGVSNNSFPDGRIEQQFS